jgi:hypothetical protein
MGTLISNVKSRIFFWALGPKVQHSANTAFLIVVL